MNGHLPHKLILLVPTTALDTIFLQPLLQIRRFNFPNLQNLDNSIYGVLKYV